MARLAKYHLVDVFTKKKFGGNQLAVFINGDQVKEEEMLTIAKELNLSETTFVFPPDHPDNDFKVRIFTPGGELPMAGHPTVGTAYVLAKTMVSRRGDYSKTLRLEEKIGVIPVEIQMEEGQPTLISMTQPNPTFQPPLDDLQLFASLLNIDPSDIESKNPIQTVSCGVPYLMIGVKSLQVIRKVKFRLDVWEQVKAKYYPGFVYVFCLETEISGNDVHGRMFAPEAGILEDPATGSANGPLGAYLVKHGLVQSSATTKIVSEQGFEMGRPSIMHITIGTSPTGEINLVQVAGHSISVGTGELFLD